MSTAQRTGVSLKGASEHDALTQFRKVIAWRPGQRKAAKTTFNRRARRLPAVTEYLDDDD